MGSHGGLFTMRASALVLLSLASVYGDSDPYTVGQVAYGATYGGVVTGIDYGYGHVAGYVAHGLPVAHAIASGRAHNVGVITGVSYGHGLGYGYYGKREAEAEADAYTIGQVAYGLPVHNAIATGHAHNVGVVTGYGYGGYGLGYSGHFYG